MLKRPPSFAVSMFVVGLVVYLGSSGIRLAGQASRLFSGSTDVGDAPKGSTAYDAASSTYRVTGGGADMWGGADAFHFDWATMTGDGSLAADVQFPLEIPERLEKAVLMFRQSLSADAPYADIAIHGDGHITVQYRAVAGGKTEDAMSKYHGPAGSATKLKIERHGDRFTVSAGPADGAWTALEPVTVALRGPVYVGLGVCSHHAKAVTTIEFSNVKLKKRRAD